MRILKWAAIAAAAGYAVCVLRSPSTGETLAFSLAHPLGGSWGNESTLHGAPALVGPSSTSTAFRVPGDPSGKTLR